MDALIVSEKFCNKCQQKKLFSEFHKCSRNKIGLQSKCKTCMNAYYMNHQEKMIQRSKDWEANNRQQKNETQKRWVLKNKDKRKKIYSDYYKNNTEKAKEATNKWKQNNKHKSVFAASKRRTIKKNACPVWANFQKIEDIYKEAADLRSQGIDVHVDHIIPLQNKFVCGLHVHNNLQIIDAKENLRKFNKFHIE